MKRFFLKKYFFAALFLIFLLGFSAVNAFSCADVWAGLRKELMDVETVEMLEAWMQEAEAKSAEETLGNIRFIETYGFMQKILGKREFNHFSYIRDDNGMLYYGALADTVDDDLDEYAGNVRRLKEVVEKKGAKLIVVLPPSKVLYGVSDVNREWPINDPNARMDKFLNLMMKNGVFAVDLRLPIMRSEEKLEDLFFKTDHHWTPLAAFLATKELVKQVEKQYGDQWDPEGRYTNLSNCQTKTYPQKMLGSQGRNAGVTYSGMDDYLLIWPKCDMEFTWYNYERGREQTGDFREALFDQRVLKSQDIYNGSINMVYLDEVTTHDKIVNHSNPNGPKLAVLRDSYFSPMACFLAPMCSEIEMVWNRTAHNDMDFEKFVEESDADYVMLEIYPYNLNEGSFYFYQKTVGQGDA